MHPASPPVPDTPLARGPLTGVRVVDEAGYTEARIDTLVAARAVRE